MSKRTLKFEYFRQFQDFCEARKCKKLNFEITGHETPASWCLNHPSRERNFKEHNIKFRWKHKK